MSYKFTIHESYAFDLQYEPFNSANNLDFKVLKTVCAYDGFSLIVELGSALGFWLGMSAISLLDIIMENWISVQHAFVNKTRKQ